MDDLSTRRDYTKDGPTTPDGARVFRNGSAGVIMLGSDGKRSRRNRPHVNPIEEMLDDLQDRTDAAEDADDDNSEHDSVKS